ncbi:hypothetical protein M3Y98_00278800 [Aphelenchoides besseyi]|nr:hypothetical protein M3Y98_00278800 [Aphelenchoides besseyi]KAI6201019.1 hypothetical protein M3Y96_00796800 [Aphelenchoides besseyi]
MKQRTVRSFAVRLHALNVHRTTLVWEITVVLRVDRSAHCPLKTTTIRAMNRQFDMLLMSRNDDASRLFRLLHPVTKQTVSQIHKKDYMNFCTTASCADGEIVF